MWMLFIAWLIGVWICLSVVNKLWADGGESMDRPWEKR